MPVTFPREPRLGMRLLHWALGIHSPTRTWLGMPSGYSFAGAMRGERDTFISAERVAAYREALMCEKGGENIRVKVIDAPR